MARTVIIPEREFTPNSYSRSVDSFPAQVQALRVTLTQPVPWPGTTEDTVAYIDISWEDGTGVSFGIPGGQWKDKAGNNTNTKVLSITVPKGPGGLKRNPIGGTGVFRVLQTLNAGLTIEVI